MNEENQPKRSNRGTRAHDLTEKEKKEDEAFWAQNTYFNDSNYLFINKFEDLFL